jgi:hypothetical protein
VARLERGEAVQGAVFGAEVDAARSARRTKASSPAPTAQTRRRSLANLDLDRQAQRLWRRCRRRARSVGAAAPAAG